MGKGNGRLEAEGAGKKEYGKGRAKEGGGEKKGN